MKNRKGVLLALGVLSLGMVATTSAVASVAGEQSWVWKGTEISKIYDMDSYNTNSNEYFSLVIGKQSWKVISMGDDFEKITQPSISIGSVSIPLDYGFFFYEWS